MIGRDRVAENAEHTRSGDVVDLADLHREILEEWRLMNVIAFFVPNVNVAFARWDLIPFWILIRKVTVELAKNLRLER